MTTAKIWDYPSDIDQKDNPFLLRGIIYIAGRKLCAINKVESVQMIRPVIDVLLKLPDKSI